MTSLSSDNIISRMLKDGVVSTENIAVQPTEVATIDDPCPMVDLTKDDERIQSYERTIAAVTAAAAELVIHEKQNATDVNQPPVVSGAASKTTVTSTSSTGKLSLTTESYATSSDTVPVVDMDTTPIVSANVDLTAEDVTMDDAFDDLFAEFDSNFKGILKPTSGS